MELILGEWNDKRIRVNPADKDYVNATDMAKACGKLWADYWRLSGTQEFATEMAKTMGIPIVSLVHSAEGRNGGTWIHRQLAIDFARWLHPSFAVWIVQRIDELITTGSTSLVQADATDRQLSVIEGIAREMRESNDLTRQAANTWVATLQALQRRPSAQIEKAVEYRLWSREGGQRQVDVKKLYRVDLVQREYIIEVKHWEQWKMAMGQIQCYSRYFDQEMRLHLFWKPFDRPPSDAKRSQIERECRFNGITVTWEDWGDMTTPGDFQHVLPLE